MMPITRLLQRAYLDLQGLYNLASIRSNCYFIIIIDDNTKKVQTYSIASKNMFFFVFKIWKKIDETETRLKLSSLQIDSRGKYVSFALKKFCDEKKVIIEFTSSYTPEQNCIAKWSWHILNIMTDAMLADSKLLKKFRTEIITIATYLKNFLPTIPKEKVTEEL